RGPPHPTVAGSLAGPSAPCLYDGTEDVAPLWCPISCDAVVLPCFSLCEKKAPVGFYEYRAFLIVCGPALLCAAPHCDRPWHCRTAVSRRQEADRPSLDRDVLWA